MTPLIARASAGAADPATSSLIGFLEAEGAGEKRHAAGRSLLQHLVETCAIVRRWEQPDWMARAALLHSVYGTDRYVDALLPLSRRDEVTALAGRRAERIAYFFSAVPRRPLLAGTYRWAPVAVDGDVPSTEELDALVLLHMANLAEQACEEDGSPGRWLAKVRQLGELLIDSETVTLPTFLARLVGFSAEDETLVRRAYRAGSRVADSTQERADRLALAASVCPVVAEPCIWQAHLAQCRGDLQSAGWWAGCARERLLELGTAWDKRLSFEQWLEVGEALADRRSAETWGAAGAIAGHPGELLEAVRNPPTVVGRRSQTVRAPGRRRMARPDPAAGRQRFQRYMDTLADAEGPSSGGVYPDLPSQPWLDPGAFPLVAYLEAHAPAIREEILSLDPSSFHRESERIQRSGDWDVAFLYERGRRRHEVCQACPVTTRGIEGHGAIRTMVGLAYASRMRAGTHIGAHRGPTNVRVRCHLGLQVPDGDCAIRVGDETRKWHEGRCLVFDDHFEHEAWNHTDQDRVVLIVDLWHPGLSSAEVTLLEGLHKYVAVHARKLNRYWAANAAAAREES